MTDNFVRGSARVEGEVKCTDRTRSVTIVLGASDAVPKELSSDEIKRIIHSGNFDELIGVIENSQFECKGEPYRLDDDHQKLELAKDVSALANAQGGIILIGAQTDREPTQATDVINRIRPFKKNHINISQYEDVLKTWIYPNLKKFEIKWFRSSASHELGLVEIIVGNEEQLWRPYLITRSVEPTGKVSTTLFGYAERGSGKSVPMSVHQIHTILRDGYRVGTGALVPIVRPGQKEGESTAIDQLSDRIEAAIHAAELTIRPIFVLAAAPAEQTEVPGLFSRSSEVVKLLESPPKLRPSGFGPDAGGNSRIVEGKCRRSVVPEYKLLEIWPDATVIFIAAGDADFLAWGNKAKTKLTLNQLVLIECTYLFTRLVTEIVSKSSHLPNSIGYRLNLRRMTVQENCFLFPGPLTTFPHGAKPSPGSDALFSITELQTTDPGISSLKLVAKVYRWFGFDDDQIPYANRTEAGEPFIDPRIIFDRNQSPIR